MNPANTAFGAVAAETFEVLRGTPGITIPGIYTARSIDDLSSGTSVVPGGLRGDNATIIFMDRDILAQSGITDGAVLKVRGKIVRVQKISDDGDNTPALNCESAGVRLP